MTNERILVNEPAIPAQPVSKNAITRTQRRRLEKRGEWAGHADTPVYYGLIELPLWLVDQAMSAPIHQTPQSPRHRAIIIDVVQGGFAARVKVRFYGRRVAQTPIYAGEVVVTQRGHIRAHLWRPVEVADIRPGSEAPKPLASIIAGIREALAVERNTEIAAPEL